MFLQVIFKCNAEKRDLHCAKTTRVNSSHTKTDALDSLYIYFTAFSNDVRPTMHCNKYLQYQQYNHWQSSNIIMWFLRQGGLTSKQKRKFETDHNWLCFSILKKDDVLHISLSVHKKGSSLCNYFKYIQIKMSVDEFPTRVSDFTVQCAKLQRPKSWKDFWMV